MGQIQPKFAHGFLLTFKTGLSSAFEEDLVR